MKKHFMLLGLTFSALLLAQQARAKEPLLGVGTEPPAGVYHFPVAVENVWWDPGCGIEPDTGPTCRIGIFMSYMLGYIDLSLYYVEDVDNTTHTITIVVDSLSDSWSHPLPPVELRTIELRSDELEPFADYTVEVLDYQYRPIWTGSIRTDLCNLEAICWRRA